MNYVLSENYERLLSVIRHVVKAMRQDYVASRESSIVRDREEVYKAYYKVTPLTPTTQERPVIFVDAGYHVAESDVASLIFVNIGGCVRDEEGKLRFAGDIGDYPNTESYFIYGRWLEVAGEPKYSVRVIPVEESALLFNEEKALNTSEELTELVNKGFSRALSRERAIKLFKRLVKYIESLLEVAYTVKLAKRVGVNSINVVDGTLARWFGVRQVKFFGFEGLDILKVLTWCTKEQLLDTLTRIYGLVKTTKFTTVARARWLFRSSISSPLGLYTSTGADLAKKAARLIDEGIKKKYGEDLAQETTLLFNRKVHPKTGIWAVRFPLTTDGTVVLHLEAHSLKPVIWYDESSRSIVADPRTADELGILVAGIVEEIMAYRTNSHGLLPHGFMEIDERVRIPLSFYHRLEDIFVQVIREETGEEGHPLEHLFGAFKRIRLGYA
ncbi:MAG: hypothetical protein QXJ26_01090 [Desulfurococcaceae archaeon]